MRKGYVVISFLILALFCLALSPAMAQAPNSITYQGRLVDGSGNVITGATSVAFRIYSTLTGGSYLYQQTKSVDPDDVTGVFTTELTGMSTAYFNGSARYLEMVIGGVALAPRQLITSVPYAYSAQYAKYIPNSSVTSAKILDGTITGADIATATITGTDIAAGSVYDSDIGDEPGVASSLYHPNFPLISGIQVVVSRSITIPTSGYVMVIAHSSVKGSHVNGTNTSIAIGISNSSTAFPASGSQDVDFQIPSAAPSGTYETPAGLTALFTESTSGTKTYYLLADEQSGNTTVSDIQFNLLFIPTAYGTVTTTGKAGVAAPDNDIPANSTNIE